MYNPSDHSGLADRVQFLLDNPAVAARLAGEGYRQAQARYSLERYGEELFRVLTRVAQERTP